MDRPVTVQGIVMDPSTVTMEEFTPMEKLYDGSAIVKIKRTGATPPAATQP